MIFSELNVEEGIIGIIHWVVSYSNFCLDTKTKKAVHS